MTAARLLRFYPRAWRERYGDEFLEMVGPGPLQVQQVVDIASGAIDAWLSAEVRGATRAGAHEIKGGRVMMKTMVCNKNETRYTTRDGAMGAAIMLIGTLFLAAMGAAFRRNGLVAAADVVLNSGFLIALTASLPFWLMKRQPRKAQLVIVGGTILLLLAINMAASLVIGG